MKVKTKAKVEPAGWHLLHHAFTLFSLLQYMHLSNPLTQECIHSSFISFNIPWSRSHSKWQVIFLFEFDQISDSLIIIATLSLYLMEARLAISAPVPPSLWLAPNPSKRWGELFFLLYTPFWLTLCLGIVIPFNLYEVLPFSTIYIYFCKCGN